MKKINKNKGFTLVELLAVIVILAIILVIAVPKIMNTIKDTTKASFESSAKMVAAQVENQYTVAQTLSKEFGATGSCKQDWAGLNDTDYASCEYEITSEGTAKVTLVGSGKFNGLYVCEGTRSSATATEEKCAIAYGLGSNYIYNLLTRESVLHNGLIVDDTKDANIRYAGDLAEVNNKVYFNCAETDGTNAYGTGNYDYESSCEIWRIIGVFDTYEDENDDEGSPRIKIVRDQVLSNKMPWDNGSGDGIYINQWGPTTLTSDNTTAYAGASLMQYLNGDYHNSLTTVAKEQIDEVLWYTGAVGDDTASGAYEAERSNATGTGKEVNYTTTWVGKIGLIYISDFGYAGTNCGDKIIQDYSQSCGPTSNWLTLQSSYWTISSIDYYDFIVWMVLWNGSVHYDIYTGTSYDVRPALYLDSNIQIIGGDGKEIPFKLSV